VKAPKVMIVGFDAATWDLAKPWVAEGFMPNLARLMAEGTRGQLESIVPPITPPAWTSFTTGKNPGKHGVFHFMESAPDTYALRYTNASSRRTRTIWKILNQAGIATGTANIPFTYPPEGLNGYQISGMDTPSEKSAFIHPPELREELERELGPLKLDIRFLGFMNTDKRRDQVLDEMRQMDEQWTRVGLYLLKHRPQDVMMLVFMSIDTVQHYFWQFMDKSHFLHDSAAEVRFGAAIRNVYQRLDESLGKLLEYTNDETTIFVVSDHGGGPVSDRVVYLNRYLEQLGLLCYQQNTNNPLRKTLRAVLRRGYTFLHSNLSSRQKIRLAALLPQLRLKTESFYTSFTSIDWSQTKAYCSEVLASPPSIWINLKGRRPHGIVDDSEYESLRDEIITKISELRDPRTGEPVIKRVLRREKIFHGSFAAEAPDLILDWWEASHFMTGPSFPDDQNEPPIKIIPKRPTKGSEWGGTHRLHGILVAKGPHLRRGAEIYGARLIDIAPTLLYLLDQPVPRDMDGWVLIDLFESEFIESHAIRYDSSLEDIAAPRSGDYSKEEAEQVEERLKALGYIE